MIFTAMASNRTITAAADQNIPLALDIVGMDNGQGDSFDNLTLDTNLGPSRSWCEGI
jgi:hypothetical protein